LSSDATFEASSYSSINIASYDDDVSKFSLTALCSTYKIPTTITLTNLFASNPNVSIKTMLAFLS